MSEDVRYQGKPLLRLLEIYVLKAIDALPVPEQEALDKLAPKLQAVYGGDGPWHSAIEAAVHMPKDMPQIIREMWDKNLEIARANDVPALTPEKFAQLFVDEKSDRVNLLVIPAKAGIQLGQRSTHDEEVGFPLSQE